MQNFRMRERSFLRAVLAHDYKAAKHTQIYPQQILMARNARMPAGLFTLFDYRAGRASISVEPLSSVFAQNLGRGTGWWNDVHRAACAQGRMELHVVALPGSARGGSVEHFSKFLVIPLRTETSRVNEVLTEIGRRFGSNATIESIREDASLGELKTLKEMATH